MKRIGALVCLIIMMTSILAPASFAANDANSQKSQFKIVSSTPHDGDQGVAVENLSVKIYFSKEVMPDNDKVRKANAKEFKLTDKKGKKIPVKVYYSEKEREDGLLMVVSDITNSDIAIKSNASYTLTIGKNLQATDGSKLGTTQTIKFRTLDRDKSTKIYTIMMVVMIVGMIFFTSRSAKKAMQKENQEKGKSETVNPYKEAKRTGKSVEEIVKKDAQRKAKEAEALAKKKAKDDEILAALEEEDDEPVSENKRVSGRRPISAAGSEYKVKVVKTQKPEKKASTNPKGQTGKQKNTKNKGKKK